MIKHLMLDFCVRQKIFFSSVYFSVKYAFPITHNINLLKATLVVENVSHSTVFLVLTLSRIIGWLDVSGETCCLFSTGNWICFRLMQNGIIHFIACFTRVPQPHPQSVPHRAKSSASSFNFQYPLFFWRSSCTCLLLLPSLAVTYILPSIFPSIMCLRRQFLRKMWPVQVVFTYVKFIVCSIHTLLLDFLQYFFTSHTIV